MSSAENFFNNANAKFVAEEYDQALELYDKAIEIDSTKPNFYENRAKCQIKLENYTGLYYKKQYKLIFLRRRNY